MVGSSDSLEHLLATDREHLWHPYSSMSEPGAPSLVHSAQGVRLTLSSPDGQRREVLDAMSSWWSAIHGYRVPELDAAASAQLASMSHVMFGGLTHEPAIELARRLVAITPEPLRHIFLADSGSVAIEVALKMAIQAARAQGRTSATRFFTIRGGYHGDTTGPMSVTDPVSGMHSLFAGILPEHIFAPRPPAGVDLPADDPSLRQWAQHTRELFARHHDEIAGVIIEPILQGAGGMHPYSPHVITLLHELAQGVGALTIHDEIATGFYRTGPRWAAQRSDLHPDVLVIGKALTGGYLTMGAVITTSEVAQWVSSETGGGGLMHGPTFMANPLAAAIASANIDLILGDDDGAGTAARVSRIEGELQAGLAPARELNQVRDVRVLGAIGVVQLTHPVDLPAATQAALDAGVWIRPFRDLVYVMPPFVSNSAETATMCQGVCAAVRAS